MTTAETNYLMKAKKDQQELIDSLEAENADMRQQLAKPAPEAQILIDALRDAFNEIEQFKGKWMQTPEFGSKVNKATRSAIALAHNHVFLAHNRIQNALAAYDTKATPDNGVEK